MFDLLVTVLLLTTNNQQADSKYTVLIDLSYWEHRNNDEGKLYHYKNWSKGTGFIYKDDDGVWVLTAAHIVPYNINHLIERSVFASFNLDLQHDPEELEFIGSDRGMDVMLFKFINQDSAKNLPHATLGISENLQVRQQVIAIGHPWPIKFTETIGHINSLDFIGFSINQNQPQLLVHSCMINSGSSGGPLVNLSNEVIGINIATIERPNVFNLAVPIDDIKFLLPKLKRGGEIKHQTVGFVGFNNSFILSDPDLDELEIYIRPPIKGIMLMGFKENSLVELVGFQKGDIVLSCNGQKPRDLIDFFKMIYLKAEPYEILKIEIDRYGQKLFLPLLLFDPMEKEVEIE